MNNFDTVRALLENNIEKYELKGKDNAATTSTPNLGSIDNAKNCATAFSCARSYSSNDNNNNNNVSNSNTSSPIRSGGDTTTADTNTWNDISPFAGRSKHNISSNKN